MAEEGTVHQTTVRYVAEDMASSTAAKISKAFHHSGEAFDGVREKMREFRRETVMAVAGVAGFGFGLFSLVEHAKEANAELVGTQKGIAGTLSTVLQWDKGTSAVDKFARSMGLARGIVGELEETAARFNMGLGDLGGAYKTVAISLAPLHLSQGQLLEETKLVSAAAKQFGITGEDAANRIGKAIVSKSIRASDDLGKFLFENVGGNLKKLNNAQILERMNRALHQSEGVAEQMGKGMGGSITRIQLRFNEMFRDLTGPLFGKISEVLDGVSKRLRTVGADGKPLLETFARRLVDGFEKLRELSGFIVDHWKAIAVVVAGIKLPGLIASGAGLLGGLAGGARGLGGIFGEVGKSFAAIGAGGGLSGIAGFVGALGPATAAIVGIGGAAVLAATALKGVYDEWQGRKKSAAELSGFFREVGEVNKTQNLIRRHEREFSADQVAYLRQKAEEHAGTAAEILKQRGLLEDGVVNVEKFNGIMAAMSDSTRDQFQSMLGQVGAAGALRGTELGALASEIFSKAYAHQRAAAPQAADLDKDRRTAGVVQHFHGDINIQQKFEDVDPDRVFVGFTSRLQNLARRPTSSPYVDPFGD